ncbi:nucleotide exchange factor GrpE [Salinicoccus roseus]|uniref:Protein GrpE n=1 Tax=Salinicoccus roseus TaxID=45670 RepID=A0A265E9D2_9STAP|nr:nucleotide exchange factor GrpE [Salinicoccus roseus]OZT78194.1 nucleotide exchange factor GrpE [Salinicoccus roseus]RPE54273.1 molecular chaperone GrpE [Salinicoccus roseus]GGA66785.1 protein GrpE [Salinicoccus roseus]
MTENKTKEELEQELDGQASEEETKTSQTETEDVAVEDAADVEADGGDEADSELKAKDEEIESLKQQVETEENKYLKLYAEFENFKRRNRQEMETNNKYKHQGMVEDLLPIIDNFERALKIEGDSDSFNSLLKGVEMVYNDLVNTLMKHDVREIESVGQPFDPNYHQAVMTEASDEDDGIVIEEFQKGYILKDRVIRPSMVKVSE